VITRSLSETDRRVIQRREWEDRSRGHSDKRTRAMSLKLEKEMEQTVPLGPQEGSSLAFTECQNT
jgi:hypothetical protein